MDSVILDVPCGTGLTGLQLHSVGFKNIDGVDLSDDMIKQAKQKGIYRHLFKDCITETSGLSCEDEIYDACISWFNTGSHGTFVCNERGVESCEKQWYDSRWDQP